MRSPLGRSDARIRGAGGETSLDASNEKGCSESSPSLRKPQSRSRGELTMLQSQWDGPPALAIELRY